MHVTQFISSLAGLALTSQVFFQACEARSPITKGARMSPRGLEKRMNITNFLISDISSISTLESDKVTYNNSLSCMSSHLYNNSDNHWPKKSSSPTQIQTPIPLAVTPGVILSTALQTCRASRSNVWLRPMLARRVSNGSWSHIQGLARSRPDFYTASMILSENPRRSLGDRTNIQP